MAPEIKALIGSIERYSLHDGPGIRTTVFFKGCQIDCPWCHNPELKSSRREIAFYPERCLMCGDCQAACPEQAIDLKLPERIKRDICTGCGLCASVCPSDALKVVGRYMTVETVMEVLLRDRNFYAQSGGGVTLSGGEPTLQMEFASRLLISLKDYEIHTAIETNGLFEWKAFEALLLPYLDLLYMDLKIADSARHKKITGAGNKIIVQNIGNVARLRADDLVVRIPLIPGYTDDQKNIFEIKALLKKLGVKRGEFLPYHPFGKSKAQRIGKDIPGGLHVSEKGHAKPVCKNASTQT